MRRAQPSTDVFTPTLPKNHPYPPQNHRYPSQKIVTSPALGGGAGTCVLAGEAPGCRGCRRAPGDAPKSSGPKPRPGWFLGVWQKLGHSQKSCSCASTLSNPDPAPLWNGSSAALEMSGFYGTTCPVSLVLLQFRNDLSKRWDEIWTRSKEQEGSSELSSLQGEGKINTSKAPMLIHQCVNYVFFTTTKCRKLQSSKPRQAIPAPWGHSVFRTFANPIKTRICTGKKRKQVES